MADSSRVSMEMYEWNNPKHRQAIQIMKGHIRSIDAKEMRLQSCGLEHCMNNPEFMNYIAWNEHQEPIAMYGVSRKSYIGYGHIIWMIGSRDLDQYKKELVRIGHTIIKQLCSSYGKVWNICLKENVQSQRWLIAAGAEFSNAFILNSHEWRLFTIERDENNVYTGSHDGNDGYTGDTSI